MTEDFLRRWTEVIMEVLSQWQLHVSTATYPGGSMYVYLRKKP